MSDETTDHAPETVSPAPESESDSGAAPVSARRRTRVSDVTTATSRRLLAGGLIVASFAAVATLHDTASEPLLVATEPAEAVTLPADGVVSAAWYCPGGVPGDPGTVTATTDDDDDPVGPILDVVYVTNTSDRDGAVRVTAFSAAEPPRGRRVPVGAGEVIELPVRELSNQPDAAVMVEAFTRSIVVEQLVGAPDRDDVALGPCATQTSDRWYFAAGSTLRDSTQWLSLLNPYAQDAVVDIKVITNDAVRRPADLQSFVVPARTRRTIAINDAADRKQIVAVVVESPQGNRIVAQQTVIHRGAGRRFGVSSTIGAVAPGRRFTFSGGDARANTTRLIYVLNPGEVSADVDILVTAPGALPTTIRVAPDSVVTVNINKIAPIDSQFAIVVEATAGFGDRPDPDRGVIVDDFDGRRVETARRTAFGVAGSVGATQPADEWRFGVSELDEGSQGRLQIYNPNQDSITVDVSYVRDGEIVRPDTMQGVEVAGSGWARIGIDDAIETQVGLIVELSGPGYVERFLVREESITRSFGVPNRD